MSMCIYLELKVIKPFQIKYVDKNLLNKLQNLPK